MSAIGRTIIILLLILAARGSGLAQSSCPANIGFEAGTFDNWTCHTGSVSMAGGVSVTQSGPTFDRHTILQNSVPQEKDPYGNFPVNCPNGSGYSIRLGNSQVQAQAERVSYTFTVPTDKNEYSFIYNYAIVFQNPNHLPEEQPKFTSSVYDETEGTYLSCGAFEFVSSSGLPGFQVSPIDPSVYYKPWSPVTVKLMGCAGKTITIEFTTNDCTRGGHFGYAYIDVNENCTSPITGNIYCNGAEHVTLQAPFGFQSYNWYDAGFNNLLGSGYTLRLEPIPPIGTVFAVEVIPYPGLGCLDTLYTSIQLSPEGFHFELMDTVFGCIGQQNNLTNPLITQGSTPNLTFYYYLDSVGLEYLPVPSHVTEPGLYYVRALNSTGCMETKPLQLLLQDLLFSVSDPPEACAPNAVDLTAPSITANSNPLLTYSYWKDYDATIPLPAPDAVAETGVYYIRGADGLCARSEAVNVTIRTDENLKLNPAEGCGSVNLEDPAIVAGSEPGFSFSFWSDAAGTTAIADPKKVTTSGTYFVKGTIASGCSFIKPVGVTINPLPSFTVTHPSEVTAPQKVSITDAMSPAGTYTYSFWTDSLATQALSSPSFIASSGNYFIKATDTIGCEKIEMVRVTINVPYHPVIKYPNAFSPNNDGVNDQFRLEIAGNIRFNTFRIFNRWGQLVFETKDPFEYWRGKKNGNPQPPGTYYWVMELVNNNNKDFYRRMGAVTLLR